MLPSAAEERLPATECDGKQPCCKTWALLCQAGRNSRGHPELSRGGSAREMESSGVSPRGREGNAPHLPPPEAAWILWSCTDGDPTLPFSVLQWLAARMDASYTWSYGSGAARNHPVQLLNHSQASLPRGHQRGSDPSAVLSKADRAPRSASTPGLLCSQHGSTKWKTIRGFPLSAAVRQGD